jgi:hypothetical protein
MSHEDLVELIEADYDPDDHDAFILRSTLIRQELALQQQAILDGFEELIVELHEMAAR